MSFPIDTAGVKGVFIKLCENFRILVLNSDFWNCYSTSIVELLRSTPFLGPTANLRVCNHLDCDLYFGTVLKSSKSSSVFLSKSNYTHVLSCSLNSRKVRLSQDPSIPQLQTFASQIPRPPLRPKSWASDP